MGKLLKFKPTRRNFPYSFRKRALAWQSLLTKFENVGRRCVSAPLHAFPRTSGQTTCFANGEDVRSHENKMLASLSTCLFGLHVTEKGKTGRGPIASWPGTATQMTENGVAEITASSSADEVTGQGDLTARAELISALCSYIRVYICIKEYTILYIESTESLDLLSVDLLCAINILKLKSPSPGLG